MMTEGRLNFMRSYIASHAAGKEVTPELFHLLQAELRRRQPAAIEINGGGSCAK